MLTFAIDVDEQEQVKEVNHKDEEMVLDVNIDIREVLHIEDTL